MSTNDNLIGRLRTRAIELHKFPIDAHQDTASLLRESIAALTAQCPACHEMRAPRNRYTAYPKRLVRVRAEFDQTVEIEWVMGGLSIGHTQETVPEAAVDAAREDDDNGD